MATGFTRFEDFVTLICTSTNLVFTILIALSVIILLFSAFLFLTSGGDEEKTGNARKYLTFAVVGVVVALLAKGIVLAVGNLLGGSIATKVCG